MYLINKYQVSKEYSMKSKIKKSIAVIFSFITVAISGFVVFALLNNSPVKSVNFNEVWSVVTENPLNYAENSRVDRDIKRYGTLEEPLLPHFSGQLSALLSIIDTDMLASAQRTINDSSDYYDYFAKLVHANGTCFSGVWEIDGDSKYSGYFKNGSKGLIVGRISAAAPQTTNDEDRSFGFAGKIFPTMNPDEKVKTANFFTVDNLNGTPAMSMLDVALVNEPPVDLNCFACMPLRVLNYIFSLADINPGVRQLYPISRLGLEVKKTPVTPNWIRIKPSAGTPIYSSDSDFRDELSAKNYPNGLVFDIDVSDTTKEAYDKRGWQHIGKITTSPFVTTFGCDRRIHFAHPSFVDK